MSNMSVKEANNKINGFEGTNMAPKGKFVFMSLFKFLSQHATSLIMNKNICNQKLINFWETEAPISPHILHISITSLSEL